MASERTSEDPIARRPPVAVLDLFNDFRDGSRLLDLLEVMCSQSMSREKSRGVFQHRTNIEKALAFLRGKSIKLVNINVSDIMDGKPSIILGLIWTIIMHFHIEELANTLSFSSRQSSLESLASLDTRSTISSARSSPVPLHGSPLHTRFKISAKKALLLWVREQCHKAGCTLNVKDFKTSWRSGVVFLAILCALRPDVVSLPKARTRSNRQNLEEAFHIAEKELRIPRLLDPADVDVRDPDEKSIMTYVAQFLQYTKDTPSSGEDIQVEYLTPPSSVSSVNLPCNFTPAVAASPFRQTSATQKAQEVTCWLEQAYQELLEGWESTEGESYAERYHVFQTFVVSFNEQRRPVMPLLTAMKRTVKLSEEQRDLRHAWDSLAEKLREYKTELDLSLPCPLDTVGRWLLRAEKALADGDDNRQDHATAAQEAREKQELFKSCLEEMPHHMKTFQGFQNMDEYGEMVVPSDKIEEIKRRFTSVRVSAKYHGIRLEYQEHRHTVLDLLTQLTSKLHSWKRGYISPEAVRVLLKDWNETVNKLGLPSMLEGTLSKLRHNANKYTSKSALDLNRVSNQMKDLEAKTSMTLEEVKMVKATIARTLTAWDTYSDTYTSLHAWLEQGTQTNRHEQRSEVTMELMSEWSSHRERLNEVGNYLIDVTDPETSRLISDDLCRINLMWADFVRRTQFELVEEQSVTTTRPQTLQGLIREAKQLLKEPVDVLSGSLQTFRKRLQFMMKKIQDIDLDSLCPSLECSAETLHKLKQTMPEVLRTLDEAMQVCEELQQSVSSLNGRLAELIHWESEVREFYELLKEKSQRHQMAQDFRTRSLISRGLQLEGQVVMEEQDLQEMVMLLQKNSPLQYLIASTMQDRVRAAVAQSQEAVGMLSALGIYRDQSPTEDQPPQKVFIHEQVVTKPKTEEKGQIKELVENLSVQSKPEAHVQDVLPKVKPKSNLVDAVSSGEPKKLSGDTNETMKSQLTHQDDKQTQEQIQQAPTIQHFLTLQQETTQPQMQTDSQQQQQVQMHKQITSQQQILQQSTKVRKSQKRIENRPWLQQKAQAHGKQSSDILPKPEDIDTAQATGPVQPQSRVTLMVTNSISQVPTTEANRVQDKNITQTQAQPSVLATFHHTVPATDLIHLEAKSVIQGTQIQQQKAAFRITQTPVDQAQQRQPVPQADLGQVNQQHPVSQMLANEQVLALSPVNSQKQPQALTTQQHPQPYTATTFTQPPKKLSEMQTSGMTRMQQPFMGQTQSSIMSKNDRYLAATEDKHQTKIHPSTQMQPQIISQGQPHIVAAQSSVKQAVTSNQSQSIIATPAKPKITAPVEPRIITMPQCQTQFCRPPQAPPQVISISKMYDNIQLRPQPNNQEPQWRLPDLMTQSYNEAPQHGFMPSNIPPQVHLQSYPQSQGITQTQAQPQQWGVSGGGLASQAYPNIHGSGHMHPNNQFQVYPSPQPQSQQWGQFQFEPTMQPYSQNPVQSFVPPQHWQPVKQTSMVSHSYPMSQYPQVQHKVTRRPQSPPQEWSMQPKPESKLKFLNLVPQPVANTPWAQPPSQRSVRAQGPTLQQPHSQQQQWSQNKSEVSFQVQIQSQTLQSMSQNQVFQKPQSPEQEQPQHQIVTQVKPFVPGPNIQQSTSLQHPPTQQHQSSQYRAEPLLHIQAQTHTIYTEPHLKVFQKPQLLDQGQPRQQSLAQVKSSFMGPVGPQGPTPQLPPDQQQQWPQYQAKTPFQLQIQSQTLQPQSQLEMLQPPQLPAQEKLQQHSVAQFKPPVQVPASFQVDPEANKNEEALAKNKFKDAKHRLQEHVQEAFNISQCKKVTQEQILFKKETLDLELLKEFLKAAQGMEDFCNTSQRQDMELFTQSIRNQWEACSSAVSSLVQSKQQLEALQQLCHILSTEDANKLAQAQPQECKSALPAIQSQSSEDRDISPTDSGVIVEQSKETSPQKAALPETPVEITTGTSPVSAQRHKTVEKKEILKQISTEEDRYRSCRFALQAQLNRNEQYMLGDRLSGSATVIDLQRRLRELKALQDETESLWMEYEVQCSQCSQINERAVEQDRAELTVMWKEQRMQLQRRVNSLGAALELMDSIQQHIAEISECLNKFIKEPKDVNGYTLINPNILKDIKDMDEYIQMQIDRLSRFDSEPSHLDLRDRSPLTQLVLKHRSSLDCLRQQVRKSDAAVRALDRFLVSLRTLDQDVLVVHSAPCADMMALQDSKSKLTMFRKGAASLSEKAPQLDQLLGGAQMTVTQKGISVTCLDMVAGLVRKVEDTDDKLIIRQEELQQEQQSKGLRMREKTLLVELQKVQDVAEKQSLTEPTIPAVQHRIRALSDLQTQINSLRPEYESIKETASKCSTNKEQCNEMEIVWLETERAVADRQEHCSNLMELLKKFQSCRSFLGNILQRAEQTITEHASYMGKDNLQRLIAKVHVIKEDLNGLGPKIEEFRAVCRQLRFHLKKLPDCSEMPFEAEADALVDSWLDISEKTDSYMDSLHMGLELWEKQLMLGEELEVWTSAKLSHFAESHPFSCENEVLEMKDEIQTQDQSLEQFSRKSLEIQELLQSKEAPLELQVMETALKKKMEQVKELFDSCTKVYQELLSVRVHLLQRTGTCQTDIQRIHSLVRTLCADNRDILQQHLQDLSDQLLDQEEEADSLIKEVELMSNLTTPQALEELFNKSKSLKDNIAVTRELIGRKKEQGEKSGLVHSIKDKCQMFEDWLQDAQLAVNECFENPEMKEDVEASMQRLEDFLASEEGDQRLAQVKKALEKRGQEEVSAETHAELCAWQQEQEGELNTLRAHCQGRHKQLKDILIQLKSGRIEAFSDLLALVRSKGLRGDPVLQDSESLVDQYHSLGIRLDNRSEIYKSLEKEVEMFHVKKENTRMWARELQQSLESLDKDDLTAEELLKIQSVVDLCDEGDSKMAALKKDGESLCACEELEECHRQEVLWTLRNAGDEWRTVLDLAQQLKTKSELEQTLLKEVKALQDEEKNIWSWMNEQMQKLDFVDRETLIQERTNKLQEVLSLKHEGGLKLSALRKKRERICDHKERKRDSIEQSQKELEEKWKNILQTAQEMKTHLEHEDYLSKNLQSFQDQMENTQAWIRKLKVTLQTIDKSSPADEIITQAQTVLVQGPDGDLKLATLKHAGEFLCTCEGHKEDTRRSVQQTQKALEQEWKEVIDFAQILRNNAEVQMALNEELKDFYFQEGIFQTWVTELQQPFESLEKTLVPLNEILHISQTVLNLQPEADLKMAALKSKGENLYAKLDEGRKQSIQETLCDVQEKLTRLMEIAQKHKNQAQLQDSLSKELQTFLSEEKKMLSWVEELKQELGSLGKSVHGTQEQIEERLNKAQAILSLRTEGNCQMSSLKRKAEGLCGREDLDEPTRYSLVQNLKSLEEEYKGVLQNAQELHSLLKSVVERLVSCQCQRQQTQSRVEQLKQQTAALPRHFPWPGLGERRHTVEQALVLLDKARSLTPTLSALRALGREMSQLTRDPSWTDPSWAAMEECVSGLIKDLEELCESLEDGICTERNCIQLLEQRSAAQDWLREQVKGFGPLPSDRHELQGFVNTLKALLQTMEREESEMRELDLAKNALMNLCTLGGRDGLSLEIAHLHDLCATAKKEITDRLVVCETRLADIDLKIAEKRESFTAQAEGILNDLRTQECLGLMEDNRNISQLKENWNILKSCEKELKKIEGKVCNLGQAVGNVPPDEALPYNIISLVDTVTQQYCRLQSKVSEWQNDCADAAVRCMRDALQVLRSWTQSTQKPSPDSVCTIQAMIKEGAALQKNLQEAVSHQHLLTDCLGQELATKLEKDASNALKDADTIIVQLQQRLQDLEEESLKNKAFTVSLETETSRVAPEVSCDWPSKLDTSTNLNLDSPNPQDISSAPVTSNNDLLVKTFEVYKDAAMSIIKETLAKSEEPPETSMGDVLLGNNLSDDAPTTESERKSGICEFSMTVNEELLPKSSTAEPMLVSTVDEYGVEFKTDDLPTTALTTTPKLKEPTEIIASESLPYYVSESVTVSRKTSEELEERDLPLDTPVSIVTAGDFSEDVDFPTADWSLTALHFDQSELKTDGLSSRTLDVQSEKLDVSAMGPVERKDFKSEINAREKMQSSLCEELHDVETSIEERPVKSVGSESLTVEEGDIKGFFTSETCEFMVEENKGQKKRIASLILDTDTVYIHTTQVPGSTDSIDERPHLAMSNLSDTCVMMLDKSQSHISSNQQELEADRSADGSTKLSQLPEENTDGSVQTFVPYRQTTETQIITRNSEQTTTLSGTRENLTENNCPQEVQRTIEPLEDWTVNNGPPKSQCRYVILERQEGVEICQDPAAKTNVPALSKPGDAVTDISDHNIMANVEQHDSETLKSVESLPAPPARVPANGETAHQQLELEKISTTVDIEEHIIKPTPPVREKVSQLKNYSTTSVYTTRTMEEKSPMIERDSSGLEKPRTTEKTLEKISLPEDLQVKPTPPTRRKDSRNVSSSESNERSNQSAELENEITQESSEKQSISIDLEKTMTQEKAFEEPLINLTPPVRQKVSSQIDSDTVLMPIESQEIVENVLKPKPSTSKDGKTIGETVAIKFPSSTDLHKEKTMVEPFLKPTPPVRRKTSQVESSALLKPTPPTRRRNSENITDTAVGGIYSSCDLENSTLLTPVKAGDEILVKPTPPVRRKALSRTNSNISIVSETKEMEENLVKPTPPTKRRDNRRVSDVVLIDLEKNPEEAAIKPTPPVRRKGLSRTTSNISIVDKITEVEETLVKPTPPTKRKDNRTVSDVVPIDLEKSLEAAIKPTPPVRRKGLSRSTSNISIVDKITEVEEILVKPTPPTRRKDSRTVSDVVSIDLEKSFEEAVVKPTPPVRRKGLSQATSNISIVDKITEVEETLVKPTPPTRRKDSGTVSDVVPIEKSFEEAVIKPTPPVRRKTTPSEIDPYMVFETQEIEETLVKPTPPIRRKEERNVIDTSSRNDLKKVAEEPNVKQTASVSEATEIDSLVNKPQNVDETLVIPTPPTSGSDLMASKISINSDLEYFVKPSPPEEPTLLTDREKSRNIDVIVPKQAEDEFSVSTLDKTNLQERADLEVHVIQFPPVLHAESDIAIIAKTQEMEEKLEELKDRKERRNVDETVPKQMETDISSSTDFDETLRPGNAKERELFKQSFLVGQETGQAESDIGIVEKAQEREEKMEKPRRSSKNMDETLHKQMEIEISSTDLDKKSADEEDITKRSPIMGQKITHAVRDISIVDETTKMEKILEKTSLTIVRDSINVDETVRPENTEEEDVKIKFTSLLGQAASRAESGISLETFEPCVPEETLMKPTPSKIKSDTVIKISVSELQGGIIETTLREIDHESMKTSSVSTESENALPKPITPLCLEKDTVTTDTDAVLVNVEEPPVQPISTTEGTNNSAEIQLIVQREDKQSEMEQCSALAMEPTEVLTEIESISLVEAQEHDASKLELAKGIDTSEVIEVDKEEEEPLGATMDNIFTEIEKMSKTRPNSILIESRLYEDPLDILKPSDADHEAQLNRLAFCILRCRNSPAALNPTDMAKQVEEAEFCRQRAQEQVASISKQDDVNGDFSTLATSLAIDPEAMQRLSCQWTEALWDASGTVHTKEAQLQLVIDYDRQLQKAKAILEKMEGELESLKMCPVESSFVEEQRLRSFLRTMDQERMVIGELIQTHLDLSPHLSQPERAAAILQQNVLQCEWKTLERSAEKSLHNVCTYTKKSFDLLEDINTLKDHLGDLHKLLGSHLDSSANWNSKIAQEMIEFSAELIAAKHRYFDLHQRSEDLSQGRQFNVEVYNIQHGIWSVKDHIDLIGEDLAFSFPTSDSPNMVRIVKETTEALAWAKKTEYDLVNTQRKVSLFPEEVHRQMKDLKKLNLQVISKQKQLTTLSEEFMIPELDEADVPLVTSLLELLASLSKSTMEKLAAAMEEIQLSLQTREKISEQIADVDCWILAHLQKKSLSHEDFQGLTAADLSLSLGQSQNTLLEAEKHSGITEALLMKSKDITSELSISENAWLYEKLTKLQEDIRGIINYEKSSILEITDVLQTQESSEQKMAVLEQKLEQIMTDMKGYTFPITKDSLSAIEPLKRMLVDHKFQLEKINTSAEGKRKELLGVICELHHKIRNFYNKSQNHERFLSHKQRVEDLMDNVEAYVTKMKDDKISKEERYKICQSLLTQISLIKLLYKEASDELVNISQDLHPSQITNEQNRLKQNVDSLNNWEMEIQNNLQTLEYDILKGIDYLSEQKVVHSFLKEVNQVLEKTYEVESNQGAIEDELKKFLKLQKNIEARMRVLEVLEIKNGHQQWSQESKDIANLAKSALEKCDQRLGDLSNSKDSLKNYSKRVRSANQFLQRTESILLPSLCSPRSCSERLKDVQQALLSLDKDFKSYLNEIQNLATLSPIFSAQKTERLQFEIQGCLLVRISTLKAQAQLRLEALQRCVNTQRSTRVCYEDLCRHVRDLETTLTMCASQKITSQIDCYDQQEKLKMLVKDVDVLPDKLNEIREWCPVHGCRGNRDDAVNSLWGQVTRLRQFARDLLAHSEQREEELIRIRKSVEKASIFLEQMEAELPECSMEKASFDQLQELLQFWSPYQDRLDCEHRSLSALELRVARLLRVPADLEQAPPIPLCQELQTMQERYNRLKSQSALGLKAVQTEMEERTKVCKELQSIRKWLAFAGPVLEQLEQVPNTEHLQELYSELCTQKSLLQRIMEGLRMKYSDMYTLVPMEIDGPLQEVSNSLQKVGTQVEVIVQKSGPLHRLDAKLSEINTGLDAVQSRLRTKSVKVAEAENAHKRVWDELDSLHSQLAAVEVELQDVSEGNPEETENLKKKLSQTQQLHTQLSKQAEDRTAFLNKACQ
ncbi:Nesprin-2 [Bagarius yarrelli]|uniref:Nesprin-2 n=1 Tax=Bagarius yarrelli TaxID=175774 RepID=A0A556V4Z0_BAGYA|nr:Nesprin-2 [Bagarius yarrelli]